MQKVLLIASEFPPGPGGIGQHAYCLAKALSTNGIPPMVLAQGDYARREEIDRFDKTLPFPIIRYKVNTRLVKYFSRIQLMVKTVKLQNPSDVVLTGKFSLWQGWLIKLLFPSINTIAILHGSEVNLTNWLQRAFTHQCISKANTLVPVSHFTASLLPDWIKNQHPCIRIIPNGIQLDVGSKSASSAISLSGHPALLTVGHVSRRKGQHRVIRALPEILKHFPEAHYHIVGRPIQQQWLEQLAQSLGVQKHITFHGRIETHVDLVKFYTGSDVLLLLSENQPDGDVEGFGIVALEANQYGVPVVGARGSGVEEAVAHQQSGVLVDGDDATEITQGIEYCLQNRQRLKQGAKSWAKKHDWAEIVHQYIPLLN